MLSRRHVSHTSETVSGTFHDMKILSIFPTLLSIFRRGKQFFTTELVLTIHFEIFY